MLRVAVKFSVQLFRSLRLHTFKVADRPFDRHATDAERLGRLIEAQPAAFDRGRFFRGQIPRNYGDMCWRSEEVEHSLDFHALVDRILTSLRARQDSVEIDSHVGPRPDQARIYACTGCIINSGMIVRIALPAS